LKTLSAFSSFKKIMRNFNIANFIWNKIIPGLLSGKIMLSLSLALGSIVKWSEISAQFQRTLNIMCVHAVRKNHPLKNNCELFSFLSFSLARSRHAD
jgi:hypothetical protein